MEKIKAGLRIVKVIKKLAEGKYLSENVFSKEEIGIKFTGKQRMHFKLPIGAIIYVAVGTPGIDNARYIPSWRDPFRLDNKETFLEKQRKELDLKYKEIYGMDKFNQMLVYNEHKNFPFDKSEIHR